MKNPLKFIQDVKQEAFKVTWPTARDSSRCINGSCNGSFSLIIFFTVRSSIKILFRNHT
jgi:hypothetical protein